MARAVTTLAEGISFGEGARCPSVPSPGILVRFPVSDYRRRKLDALAKE